MKLLTTGIFTLVLIIIGFLFIVLIPINLGYSNEPDIRLGEYEEIDTNNDLKYEGIELTFLNYGISSETVINVEIKSVNFHYTMVNDIFFPNNDKLTIGAGKIARISFTSIDQVFIENDFLEIKIYLSFTGLENSYLHVIEPNFSPNDTFFENIIYTRNKSDTDSGNFLLMDDNLDFEHLTNNFKFIDHFKDFYYFKSDTEDNKDIIVVMRNSPLSSSSISDYLNS